MLFSWPCLPEGSKERMDEARKRLVLLCLERDQPDFFSVQSARDFNAACIEPLLEFPDTWRGAACRAAVAELLGVQRKVEKAPPGGLGLPAHLHEELEAGRQRLVLLRLEARSPEHFDPSWHLNTELVRQAMRTPGRWMDSELLAAVTELLDLQAELLSFLERQAKKRAESKAEREAQDAARKAAAAE